MLRCLAIAFTIAVAGPARAETVKIVGLGASTCDRFNKEIVGSPLIERDYFAWAQGFMSGALMRAPPGVDEGLDLSPPSVPLESQADFLRSFCAEKPDQDYMDAARALYHRLRGPKT
ncbi:hypothetical protein [Methylobacterium durans]|uniref:Rap1a immunity protein domain-containing protein n=1 Tax=Methylobacterium durans TaxID=2202825 RepID=A0A2U8WB82_9HYPH|nr:hypothetical protein [Methylobacterium durans]AWN42566.1 hypothetical protein DK389_21235 [Methylobacterium durans]